MGEEGGQRFGADEGDGREKQDGDQQPEGVARGPRLFHAQQEVHPAREAEDNVNGKVDAWRVLPKEEVKQPAERNCNQPESIRIGFHFILLEQVSNRIAPPALRSLSKAIRFYFNSKNYNPLRSPNRLGDYP